MNIPKTASEFLSLLNEDTVTWLHPSFPEFVERFNDVMDINERWRKDNPRDRSRPFTRRALEDMAEVNGDVNVEYSLAWMKHHGGDDDHEVMSNIVEPWEDDPEGMCEAEVCFQRECADVLYRYCFEKHGQTTNNLAIDVIPKLKVVRDEGASD